MPNIMQTIEQHPVIASVLVGGVGILVTIYFINKSNANNSVTGVPTDAAGNPLTGGLNVSPPLSNSDLSTMLQDMEQQILNWEQQFQDGHTTTGNGNGSGNNGSGNGVPGGGRGIHNPPGDTGVGVIFNPPGNPPANNPPWWKSILTTNPGTNINDANAQSWYKVPVNMTENAIAAFFGETWQGIGYNPHNQSLFGGSFLSQSYNQNGNNIIPAGTYLWIPTSGIKP